MGFLQILKKLLIKYLIDATVFNSYVFDISVDGRGESVGELRTFI